MRVTLEELSPQYRAEAARLREYLRVLRRDFELAQGDERFLLRRRITQLTEMLTQTRELAELTAHYYERSRGRNAKYRI